MIENKEQLQTIVDQVIKRAQKNGSDQAEALLLVENGFSVSARKGDVETLEHHKNKSLDVSVYHQQCSGSASTSDFSFEAINDAVDKACSIARYTSQDTFSGLPDPDLLAFDYPDLNLYHHWDLTPKQAIAMAVECETLACQQDSRIKSSEEATVNTFDAFKIYANSLDFVGSFLSSSHSLSCGVIAEDGHEMQRDYEYTTAHDATQLLTPDVIAQQVADKTVRRLGSRRLKTQRCPVIFNAPTASGLLGHFIRAITGGNLYRGTSFLLDHLGQTIFPDHVSLIQNPHEKGVIGSAPFDSDGVRTQPLNYIEKGVLTNYSLGVYSARKLGLRTTGNAGGVHNVQVTHSAEDLNALLKKMGTGLFVTELMGQGINLVTGDYSRGAAGFWIENGEIQYPVHEITIAGNLKDIFVGIVQIANDVDHRRNIKTGSILIDQMMVAGE